MPDPRSWVYCRFRKLSQRQDNVSHRRKANLETAQPPHFSPLMTTFFIFSAIADILSARSFKSEQLFVNSRSGDFAG
jgi:hypothetical protein